VNTTAKRSGKHQSPIIPTLKTHLKINACSLPQEARFLVKAVLEKGEDLLVHHHTSMASYQHPYIPSNVQEVADDHPFQSGP
jgi:hypothetical protein